MRDATDSHRYQHPLSTRPPLATAQSASTACTTMMPTQTSSELEGVLDSLAASLAAYASTKCRPNSFAHHELASEIVLQQQIAMTAVMRLAIERSGTGLGLDEVYAVVRGVQAEEVQERARPPPASFVAPTPSARGTIAPTPTSSRRLPTPTLSPVTAPLSLLPTLRLREPLPRPVWADALAPRPVKVDTFLADTQRGTMLKEQAALEARVEALKVERDAMDARVCAVEQAPTRLTSTATSSLDGSGRSSEGSETDSPSSRPPHTGASVAPRYDERITRGWTALACMAGRMQELEKCI